MHASALLVFLFVSGAALVIASNTCDEEDGECRGHEDLIQDDNSAIQTFSQLIKAKERKGNVPEKCKTFAHNCGTQVDDSWPDSLSSWTAMQDGFVACCLAAGRTSGTCDNVAAEVFAPHVGSSFSLEETFCEAVDDLRLAHFASAADVSAINQQDVAALIASRIIERKEQTSSLFKHMLQKTSDMAGAALLQSAGHQQAALAAVSASVATYMQGCQDDPLYRYIGIRGMPDQVQCQILTGCITYGNKPFRCMSGFHAKADPACVFTPEHAGKSWYKCYACFKNVPCSDKGGVGVDCTKIAQSGECDTELAVDLCCNSCGHR